MAFRSFKNVIIFLPVYNDRTLVCPIMLQEFMCRGPHFSVTKPGGSHEKPVALNCTLDRICESNTAQLRLGNGMGFVPKYDLHRYSVKYPEDPRGVPETLRHPHHSSHVIRIDCLFPLVANDENQIGPSTSVVLLESSLIHEQQGKWWLVVYETPIFVGQYGKHPLSMLSIQQNYTFAGESVNDSWDV